MNIKTRSEEGMSLIEVLIALAMLGIILVAYLTMFNFSFDHIFRMGSKTSAMSDAQEIIDSAYIARNTDDSYIQGLSDETYFKVDCSLIDSVSYTDYRVVYCVGTEVVFNETLESITVKVFYRTGHRHC